MSITLNTAMNYSQTAVDAGKNNAAVHLQEDTGTVNKHTGLGFRFLSSAVRSAKCQQSMDSFRRALLEHPAYAQIQSRINTAVYKIQAKGAKLTVKDSVPLKTKLDNQAAQAMGQLCVSKGVVPPGTGSNCADYLLSHGVDMSDPLSVREQVRGFVLEQITADVRTELNQQGVPLHKLETATKVLVNMESSQSLFAHDFDGLPQMTDFKYENFRTRLLSPESNAMLGFLSKPGVDALMEKGGTDAVNAINTLHSLITQGSVQNTELEGLCGQLIAAGTPLGNATEIEQAITEYRLNQSTLKSVEATLPPTLMAIERMNPPLTKADSTIFQSQISALMAGSTEALTGSDSVLKDAVSIIAASRGALLEAIANNQGQPLSCAHVWNVVTGEAMPPSAGPQNFFGSLTNSCQKSIYDLYDALAPGTGIGFGRLSTMLNLGVPMKRMAELLRPGGEITLNDLTMSNSNLEEVSDFDTIDSGVVEDYQRLMGRCHIRMASTSGEVLNIINTEHQAKKAKPADEPVFQSLLKSAREISQNDFQARAVVSFISQLPLFVASPASTLLSSGWGLSPHAAMDTRLEQQPDGTVRAHLESPAELPFGYKQSWSIAADGSATCLDFHLSLRPGD